MTWADLWKDTQEIIFIAAVVGPAMLGMVVLFLRSKFMSRDGCIVCRTAITDRVDDLEDGQTASSVQVTSLENAIENAPTAKDITDMRLALKELSGKIETMGEQVKGQANVLDIVRKQGERMNSYLLEKRGRVS